MFPLLHDHNLAPKEKKTRLHFHFTEKKSDFITFHFRSPIGAKSYNYKCATSLVFEEGRMASESSVDSMWMENLEEWVGDQNEVVTVKSLSRGLKVM